MPNPPNLIIKELNVLNAILDNDIEMMNDIIEDGDLIKEKDNNGNNALHLASHHGNLEIFDLLIKSNKIDINSQNNSGDTALHLAAYYGREKIVKLLIDSGKIDDINAKDKGDDTALDLAARNGYTNIAQLLAQNGGTSKITDNQGLTQFDRDRNEYSESINSSNSPQQPIDNRSAPKDGAITTQKEDIIMTPEVLNAIVNDDRKMMNDIIRDGDLLKGKDNNGNNALHLALKEGKTKIAKSLIESGKIDINAQNNTGKTALHLAVSNENTTIAKLLIANKHTSINSKDHSDSTALHLAAFYGSLEIVKLLIESGKIDDINAKDKNNDTALDLAQCHAGTALSEFLIKNNATSKITDNQELTQSNRDRNKYSESVDSSNSPQQPDEKLTPKEKPSFLSNPLHLSSAVTYFGEIIRNSVNTNIWSNVDKFINPFTNTIGKISDKILDHAAFSPMVKLSTSRLIRFIAPVQIMLGLGKGLFSLFNNLYKKQEITKSISHALCDGAQTIAECGASSIGRAAGITAASYIGAGTAGAAASIMLPVVTTLAAGWGAGKICEYSKDAVGSFVRKYTQSSAQNIQTQKNCR